MTEKPKARGPQGRLSSGKKQKDFFVIPTDENIKLDFDNVIIKDAEKKAKGGRVGLKSGGKVARGCGRVMSNRRKKTKTY